MKTEKQYMDSAKAVFFCGVCLILIILILAIL